ncbi:MAG TPA: alpha/beta hydrolase family protein [Thermogutta sp.]|nr:alpha/beta hydrolase family protein [Thermogutta sp.]HPZ81866.1 alpha/beta hydrolase family protein [Thermogutta sp.]
MFRCHLHSKALLYVSILFLGGVATTGLIFAQPRPEWKPLGPLPGDAMLADYFQVEVGKLQAACLADIKTLEDWQARCEEYRRQLREMLGLDPWPKKTDLKATITGMLERDDFRVEKLHFQSMPGLYVTANLYLPKNITKPVPAVLYLCGHAQVKIDNVSYGNKAHYHFHAVWFARHGYACLVLDSLQLGEIEGIHHGTYRYGMWWWNNRGYTPAGVEAWNCVRALDYLQSRPEIDGERIGVTGRSGGGAYSWWIAAIDPRIKAAVPVAGITDLQNHVIDGCVEGHCDCMYIVNTYRWDYPMVAALVAPRPLLIDNGDHDPIFPEDGVRRVYEQARKIYQLYGAEDKIAIFITTAGHDDIPTIQEAAFRWLDRHLMGKERDTYDPVEKVLTPQELKVFETLPGDQLNTTIHEHFVPAAPVVFPQNQDEWKRMQTEWLKGIREKCFRGWPGDLPPATLRDAVSVVRDGVRLTRAKLDVQDKITLPVYRLELAAGSVRRAIVEVLDQTDWQEWLKGLKAVFADDLTDDLVTDEDKALAGDESAWKEIKARLEAERGTALVLLMPRGVGPTRWNAEAKKQTQIERRFMLIGQTSDGMRVLDILRGLQAIRSSGNLPEKSMRVRAKGKMGVLACYAAMFETELALELDQIPLTHRDGPYILNISKVLEVPQAVFLAAQTNPARLTTDRPEAWQPALEAAQRLGWPESQLRIIKRE